MEHVGGNILCPEPLFRANGAHWISVSETTRIVESQVFDRNQSFHRNDSEFGLLCKCSGASFIQQDWCAEVIGWWVS